MNEKILIVDDEESIRYTFSEILDRAGYSVESSDSLFGCVKMMQARPFDLLLLDIGLGLDNGVEAIESLQAMQPGCKIVIITGNPRPQSLVLAKNRGAFDYLAKPVRQASLLYNVRKTLGCQAVATSLYNGPARPGGSI